MAILPRGSFRRVVYVGGVAVLVLLTLQTSFLLPPFGYALMMVRGVLKEPVALRPFVRALMPFLLAQWLLLGAVLLVPALVHVGESAADRTRTPLVPVSDQEINRRLEEMLPPVPELPSR